MSTKNEEWQENFLKHNIRQLPAQYLQIKALTVEQNAAIFFWRPQEKISQGDSWLDIFQARP